MQRAFIKSETDSGVLVLTMHDPKTRNSIGLEMMAELEEELDRLESDPTLRAVVLTGTDPSFCSGANVKQMGTESEANDDDPLPDLSLIHI